MEMKQQRLKLAESPVIEATASLLVARSDIPRNLSEADKVILRKHLDPINAGHTFFFRDCAEVRRVLGITE